MATARYWRLTILANFAGSFKGLSELAFLDAGGVDLSTGGTAFASSSSGAFTADKAFDKNNATEWNDNAAGVAHIGYDHAVAVTPARIRVHWASNINFLPTGGEVSLRVQYSTNNVDWSTAFFLELYSGTIAASTTSEFVLRGVDSLVVRPVGSELFAGSAIPLGLSVNYLPDGVVPYRDFEFGGFGRVAGTVKEDGSPDVPVKRRVRLHREQDGLLVREVWSHPVTGAYSFDYIDATKVYTVITYDYEHDYRAVIADNITPEPMP